MPLRTRTDSHVCALAQGIFREALQIQQLPGDEVEGREFATGVAARTGAAPGAGLRAGSRVMTPWLCNDAAAM